MTGMDIKLRYAESHHIMCLYMWLLRTFEKHNVYSTSRRRSNKFLKKLQRFEQQNEDDLHYSEFPYAPRLCAKSHLLKIYFGEYFLALNVPINIQERRTVKREK